MSIQVESSSRWKSSRQKVVYVPKPRKRNTACHQCRKRKLKCDARKPCTACLRTYANLVDHAPPDTVALPYPDCTYDEVTSISKNTSKEDEEADKLKKKIDELEALLRDMAIKLQASQTCVNNSRAAITAPPEPVQVTTTVFVPEHPVERPIQSELRPFTESDRTELSSEDLFQLACQSFEGVTDIQDSAILTGDSVATCRNLLQTDYVPPLYNQDMFAVTNSGWSIHLPDPSTTRHLVQAFFKFNIHANRLFHAPTFLATLCLHPLDPRFPTVSVLHGLCAVGSLYTTEIPADPSHTDIDFPYLTDHGRWRRALQGPDSFAVRHSKLAMASLTKFFEGGDHLVEGMQTNVLLSMFYMHQSMWSKVFMVAGLCLRSTIPLGMNKCAPFKTRPRMTGSAGPVIQEVSVIPDAETTIEEETRRNIFWLSYAIDRQQSISRDFALALDDRNIQQMLPIRGDHFHYGVAVPIEDRQLSVDKNILGYHPPQATDSFTLYIKSAMLISHVKSFNVRYKARRLIGDPDMYNPAQNTDVDSDGVKTSHDALHRFDPRETVAFRELDTVLMSFKSSFPQQFSSPVKRGTVDAYLYSASVAAYLSIILLHDPHANIADRTCPSRERLSQACCGILDLIYLISSTTYDVALLDHFSIAGWYFAGRVLTRFLYAAIQSSAVEDIATYSMEINHVHAILGKTAARLSSAQQYQRILREVVTQTCGDQYILDLTVPLWTSSIDPTDVSADLDMDAFFADLLPTL